MVKHDLRLDLFTFQAEGLLFCERIHNVVDSVRIIGERLFQKIGRVPIVELRERLDRPIRFAEQPFSEHSENTVVVVLYHHLLQQRRQIALNNTYDGNGDGKFRLSKTHQGSHTAIIGGGERGNTDKKGALGRSDHRKLFSVGHFSKSAKV